MTLFQSDEILDDVDDDLPENIPPLVVGISLIYLGVLVVSLAWCYFGSIEVFRPRDPQVVVTQVLWSFLTGILLVFLITVIHRRSRIFDNLEGAVRSRLGDLTRTGVLSLSLLSSVAEEFFFRGAIQTTVSDLASSPMLGLVVTSLLFGFLHMGRDKTYVPWTLFAIGCGFILGYGFMVTGNILVPITIHFLINGINMWRIIHSPEPASS